MPNKPPKILIGLPTMSSIHTYLMVIILRWMHEAYNEGKIGMMLYPTLSVQPVDNARNEIVDEFLKSDCTHLLFIDSDTIPPPDALQRLLAHDKPIVSALTPIIEHDQNLENECGGFYKKWNCVGMDDKHVKPDTGLVPIKGAGSSCILIKREVFESMDKPYYRFQYQDDNGKDTIVSEDIRFTIMAISKGFQPYADTSVICKHYKPILW